MRLWPRANAIVPDHACAFVSGSTRIGSRERIEIHFRFSASVERFLRSPMISAFATSSGHSLVTTALVADRLSSTESAYSLSLRPRTSTPSQSSCRAQTRQHAFFCSFGLCHQSRLPSSTNWRMVTSVPSLRPFRNSRTCAMTARTSSCSSSVSGINRATGLPLRVIRISSPRATRSRS